MTAVGQIVIPIGLAAVGLVLLLGLVNTLRGGNPYLSQKLMRRRVGLQFAVIIVIMGALWFAAKH